MEAPQSILPIKRRRRWWLFVILLVLTAFLCRACMLRPSSNHFGSHFNQSQNAAWLGIEWVNEPMTEEAVATLVQDLAALQINTIFVYVSYYKNGTFNPSYPYAEDFLEKFKAATRDIRVLAWIGLPLGNEADNLVDLSNQDTRQNTVAFSKEMMGLGFDGIHLDPEPAIDGDENLLLLLEETRLGMGEGILSIATPRIWPVFPNFAWPSTLPMWRSDYYREVAKRVDQIAVMVYDSAMPFTPLYWQWSRFQTIHVSQALKDSKIEVFIGIPTSEEATLTHRPSAEHMESGLKGTIAGLNDNSASPEVITGVAIYPYWETDNAEWDIYRDLWLGVE